MKNTVFELNGEVIEILDRTDKNLTYDLINEAAYFGAVNGYWCKDYLYTSEIRRADGAVVALIHHQYEIR